MISSTWNHALHHLVLFLNAFQLETTTSLNPNLLLRPSGRGGTAALENDVVSGCPPGSVGDLVDYWTIKTSWAEVDPDFTTWESRVKVLNQPNLSVPRGLRKVT